MIKLFIYRVFNPILVSLAIKILSWEPPKGKPNPVTAGVTRKLAVPEILQEGIPPIKITDLKPSISYQQILKERTQAGKPIKPPRTRGQAHQAQKTY